MTESPLALVTGMDSPVSRLSSSQLWPSRTVPSTGTAPTPALKDTPATAGPASAPIPPASSAAPDDLSERFEGMNPEQRRQARALYGRMKTLTPEQRAALTEMIVKATKSKAWAEAVEKNAWTPALLTGKAFDEFVDRDFAGLRAIMVKSGMI